MGRWGWGAPWFPLLPSEGAAQVPSWRWMARPEWGMLRPFVPSHSLCGDRCSCRGPVPLHHPSSTPASSPASSHQVSDPHCPEGALGGWEGLAPLETCPWWGASGGMGAGVQPPPPSAWFPPKAPIWRQAVGPLVCVGGAVRNLGNARLDQGRCGCRFSQVCGTHCG